MYEIKLVTVIVFIVFTLMYLTSKLFKNVFFRGPRGLEGLPGPMGATGSIGKDADVKDMSLFKVIANTLIEASDNFKVASLSINTLLKSKVYVDEIRFVGRSGTIKLRPTIYMNSGLDKDSGKIELLVNDMVFSTMSLKEASEYKSSEEGITLYLKNYDIIKIKVKTDRRDLLVKYDISSRFEHDKLLFINLEKFTKE